MGDKVEDVKSAKHGGKHARMTQRLEAEYRSPIGRRWEAAAQARRLQRAAAHKYAREDKSANRRASGMFMRRMTAMLAVTFLAPAMMCLALGSAGLIEAVQGVAIYAIGVISLFLVLISWATSGGERMLVKVAARDSKLEWASKVDDVDFPITVPGLPNEEEEEACLALKDKDDDFLLFAHARQLRRRRLAWCGISLLIIGVIEGGVMLVGQGGGDFDAASAMGIAGWLGGCFVAAMMISAWCMFKTQFYSYGEYEKYMTPPFDFGVTPMEMELARRGFDWKRMS